jgi:hypothetical protein
VHIACTRGSLCLESTMTEDEFQRRYYGYDTDDRELAEAEAASITLEDGTHPVVVGFPFESGMRYCLMLPTAAAVIEELYG